jgi:hypothetical protein
MYKNVYEDITDFVRQYPRSCRLSDGCGELPPEISAGMFCTSSGLACLTRIQTTAAASCLCLSMAASCKAETRVGNAAVRMPYARAIGSEAGSLVLLNHSLDRQNVLLQYFGGFSLVKKSKKRDHKRKQSKKSALPKGKVYREWLKACEVAAIAARRVESDISVYPNRETATGRERNRIRAET